MTSQHETYQATQSSRAFTLTELLVVIGIMALLMVVAVPAVRAITGGGQYESGIMTVSSAVAAARAQATTSTFVTDGEYKGAAAVFLSDSQIRMVRHTAYATSNRRPLYTDIDSDPAQSGAQPTIIELPGTVSVLGLGRAGSPGNSKTYLFAPPFAVRFNAQGHLVSRSSSSANPTGDIKQDMVHYDSADNAEDVDNLDAIIGVLVYDAGAYADAGNSPISAGDAIDESTDEYKWLTLNGEVLLFNRYSGARVAED